MMQYQNIVEEYEQVAFYFYPELSLIEVYFKPTQEPMFPKKYRTIMLDFASFCEKHRARNPLFLSWKFKIGWRVKFIPDWQKVG